MSIRFQNNRNFISNTVWNFQGATSFTWALRLLVVSLSGSDEVLVFGGQFYSMFSLRFNGVSGSNVNVTVGITTANGFVNSSSVQIPLNKACALIGTYDGATLRLYLNGTAIATAGGVTAAITGQSAINVGVDPSAAAANRNYYIDDIMVWKNVVLTSTQMRNYRDGVAFETDPGTPFFSWTCEGVDGADVTAGAAGVSNAGIAAATITSPAPTFSSQSLAYTAYAKVSLVYVAPSQTSIVVYFADTNTNAAVAPTALTTKPTITIDGLSSTLGDPIWEAGVRDYAVYPLSVSIPTSATVLFSAVAGWATAGTLGEVQTETNRAVTNPYVVIADLPAGYRTMELGWNTNADYYWSPVAAHANLMKCAKLEWGIEQGSTNPVATYDPITKFPTEVRGGEIFVRPIIYSFTTHDDRGYPNLPNGEYTLLWDGAGTARVIQENSGHSFFQTTSSLTGTKNKRRTYSMTLSTSSSDPRGVQFRIVFSGEVRNMRLYGPRTPLDGSMKFHPDYLKMLEGARVIRFMDATVTNASAVASYDDIAKPEYFTFDHEAAIKRLQIAITSIGPYSNSDGFFFPDQRSFLLVTTSSPHGFKSGQTVRLMGLGGGTGGAGQVRMNNGNDLDVMTPTDFAPAPVRVISATTFAISVYTGGATGSAAQPNGTQSFTGRAEIRVIPGMPFINCIEVSNIVGADPWICIPHSFDDNSCAALATDMVSALGAGRKLYVEFSNEHWNFASSFQQSYHLHGVAAAQGLTDTQGYSKRAGEVHAIFAQIFARAGRPRDLVRVFGTQAGNTSVTTSMVNYCQSNNIPIDVIAIAPYFQNFPRTFPARWVNLTVEQLHDLSDIAVVRYRGIVTGHRNILRAKFPNANVICYEGGMELGVPEQEYGGNSATAASLSRQWVRHPRIRKTILQYCKNLEDEGCTLFAYFSLAGVFGNYAGLTAGAIWSAHQRTAEPDGLGDGSDGLNDNRNDLEDMSNTVSVVGYAVKEWISKLRPVSTPPRPQPAKEIEQ